MLSPSMPVLSMIRLVDQLLPHKDSIAQTVHGRAYISSTLHCYRPYSRVALISRIRTTQLPVVSCSPQDFVQSEDDDPRAVETVLKLYTAIKNKNFNELSDIIGEECLCICNFVSSFQPFRGKEKVLAFFSSLMKNLGNKIEFVVEPTYQDGMTVGVSWKLEWKDARVQLGKGFSFYMCHVYQGKMLIKNIEIFLEPLLHLEPLRLKTIASMAGAMEGMSSRAAKVAYKILFILLLAAALLLFCRHSS